MHAAGGWVGGTIADSGFFANADKMWDFNVRSAMAGAPSCVCTGADLIAVMLGRSVAHCLRRARFEWYVGGGALVVPSRLDSCLSE